MFIQSLRSALFYLLFLGQTVILAIVVGTIAIVARRRVELNWRIGQYWGESNKALLRWIVGIRTEVAGSENIPPGGCILAAKHQSDWDIFAILPYTVRPAFIAKKELMNIPFFGWAAASLDTITIDRSRGGQAIPAMMEDARGAISRGCRIIIFPEGTRRAPLAEPDYKWGLARMYVELGVPVVPVALNSGLFWGRNSRVLWPGTAQAQFLPPIEPGLSLEEFQRQLVETIEAHSDRLALDAVDRGLSRPVTPQLAERIAAARVRTGRTEKNTIY